MNKKTWSIISAVVLVITLAINMISTFGLFGVTPVKEISDRFANLLVPMGYTFSVIWTVIYIGLLYYTIKDLAGKEEKYNFNLLFIISNVLNVLWIVTFTNGMYLMSCFAIVGLFIVLNMINSSIKDMSLTKIIFSIYTTWIAVASTVSITSYLVSLETVAFDSIFMKLISVGLLLGVTIFVLFNKNNIAMKLTYVFALIGIAVNHIIVFNVAYIGMFIIVAAVILFVLYSLLIELLKDGSKGVRPNEAL